MAVFANKTSNLSQDAISLLLYSYSKQGAVTKFEAARVLEKFQVVPLHLIHSKKFARAIETKNSISYSSFNEDFKYLQSYLEKIKECNEGAVIEYEVVKDVNNNIRFGRLALVMPTQIKSLKGARPIISLDAGALKNQLWGTYQVLVCGGQDGENQDLIFAIAICPSESEESYTFLINAMKQSNEMKDFVLQDGLVVTTDRCKGVENAVAVNLVNAKHRFCALHLFGNLKNVTELNSVVDDATSNSVEEHKESSDEDSGSEDVPQHFSEDLRQLFAELQDDDWLNMNEQESEELGQKESFLTRLYNSCTQFLANRNVGVRNPL